MWIDTCETPKVGSLHFLVEVSHSLNGWERFDLRDRPAHTNQSCQPRLSGWCGSWNDTSTFGRGIAKMTRIARNGRVCICNVDPASAEGKAFLEEMGYPDLT